MAPLDLGNDLVGAVLGVVLSAGMTWVTGRPRRPSSGKLERKVEALVSENLPESVAARYRQQAISELTQIALPTLQVIFHYVPNSPTTVLNGGVSSGTKKARTSKTAAKKVLAPAKRTTAKKAPTEKAITRHTVRKSSTKKSAVKAPATKAPAKKSAAKTTGKRLTKKAASKKTVPRSGRR